FRSTGALGARMSPNLCMTSFGSVFGPSPVTSPSSIVHTPRVFGCWMSNYIGTESSPLLSQSANVRDSRKSSQLLFQPGFDIVRKFGRNGIVPISVFEQPPGVLVGLFLGLTLPVEARHAFPARRAPPARDRRTPLRGRGAYRAAENVVFPTPPTKPVRDPLRNPAIEDLAVQIP